MNELHELTSGRLAQAPANPERVAQVHGRIRRRRQRRVAVVAAGLAVCAVGGLAGVKVAHDAAPPPAAPTLDQLRPPVPAGIEVLDHADSATVPLLVGPVVADYGLVFGAACAQRGDLTVTWQLHGELGRLHCDQPAATGFTGTLEVPPSALPAYDPEASPVFELSGVVGPWSAAMWTSSARSVLPTGPDPYWTTLLFGTYTGPQTVTATLHVPSGHRSAKDLAGVDLSFLSRGPASYTVLVDGRTIGSGSGADAATGGGGPGIGPGDFPGGVWPESFQLTVKVLVEGRWTLEVKTGPTG